MARVEMKPTQIQLSKAEVSDEHRRAAARALDSGWYILGEECKQFEAELARYFGVEHAVLCTSATSAITLTLLSWGVGPGDEVIVPSLTAFPTAEAVYNAGATPVYADVDERYGMDPSHAEKLVSKKTKGIIPVHLYGQPVDLDAIAALAKKKNLWVLEDCAQAHGAKWKEKRVGGFGRAAALSFYPSKNLTVFGDGGSVLTNDGETARKVKQLRDHGRKDKYLHEVVGWNLRFNDIQGALGRVSLANLDRYNEARRAAAARYRAGLAKVRGLELPQERAGGFSVYHLFVIRLLGKDRDEVAKKLAAAGVQTGVHYPVPCHQQPAVTSKGKQAALPRTDALVKEILSLPMHPLLTESDTSRVCSALQEALA
ncbi:DegT/DnrJ/EryC1/StrS family aminotransferase [bacterium]|nr:DegT/DnrJ/EryC1/StrS family aminotransferase [bacterium]